MANTMRLKLQLKLLENDRVVSWRTTRVKARARAYVEAGLTSERKGVCRVWYNEAKDYWNEFEFRSLKEFNEILSVDTEQDLVVAFA